MIYPKVTTKQRVGLRSEWTQPKVIGWERGLVITSSEPALLGYLSIDCDYLKKKNLYFALQRDPTDKQPTRKTPSATDGRIRGLFEFKVTEIRRTDGNL